MFLYYKPEDQEDHEPALEELEELEQREVLGLGLDGSGKSMILHTAGRPHPTWGCNSVRLEVHLLEIGGSQNLRFYWKEFVNQVDVLVFMVDSLTGCGCPGHCRSCTSCWTRTLTCCHCGGQQAGLSEARSMVELQQELGLQAVHSQQEVFF
ncbi:hypothetical protein QTO34_016849 [Cnephaeus nilssonii]|uniref:ADP-ribosylation factor-like protein 10 n=1 Tax=Cnephaeus nilssonii TaxID=3371016 RepID=A0AA40I3Q3_CNENI|nr:hypothetical protein QTO34_016849 [Eptesicus nilssonii]